ncbi:PIN domain-containing protein [Candidatus Micrarchaeota archaeon]|nr:PIN domain-containing protein [Candidatus Micrarchaeota archaeon]
MNLLYTSILIADFNPSDSQHVAARGLDLQEAVINELVFAEVANVLERRVSAKESVLPVLLYIREQIPIFQLPLTAIDEGLCLFSKHFRKVSFTDCMLIVQARQNGYLLVTFDQNLKKAAEAEGVQVEP